MKELLSTFLSFRENCFSYLAHFFFSQAWNIQTSTELSLNGPVGQVYALLVGNDLLFAGVQVIVLCKIHRNIYTFLFQSNLEFFFPFPDEM